jgi:hypothetical protein
MELSFYKLHQYTERNIKRALGIATPLKLGETIEAEIPGYNLKPGQFKKAIFLTMFMDIRESTARAFRIGPEKTFVTLQGLIPTCARIVEEFGGYIMDYPGDGIMAHWELDETGYAPEIHSAVKAACFMEDAVAHIVNPILGEYQIEPLKTGIGISAGEVILTKVGIPGAFQSKVIGNSVNEASKLSGKELNPDGKVRVNPKVMSLAFADVTHQANYGGDFIYRIPDGFLTIETPLDSFKIPRIDQQDRVQELMNIMAPIRRLGK